MVYYEQCSYMACGTTGCITTNYSSDCNSQCSIDCYSSWYFNVTYYELIAGIYYGPFYRSGSYYCPEGYDGWTDGVVTLANNLVGIVAGCVVGGVVLLIGGIIGCAACAKCCCFAKKANAQVVVPTPRSLLNHQVM